MIFIKPLSNMSQPGPKGVPGGKIFSDNGAITKIWGRAFEPRPSGQSFLISYALILHQFQRSLFDIVGLRQDEIFDLRCVGDEGVGRSDTFNRGVEVLEQFVRNAGGDLGAIAP